MNKKIQKLLLSAGVMIAAATGGILLPVDSRAAVKDTEYIAQIEKKMLSASTSKIQYQYGKIKSMKSGSWSRAAKLSLSAKKWSVPKKGWYTLRIRTTGKKYKKLQVKLKKKTYVFTCNQTVKKKAGYYAIVPKGQSLKGLAVADSSTKKAAGATVEARTDLASFVWRLESAGGKKFRLINVNSGLYLEAGALKQTSNVRQNAGDAKDETIIFQAVQADGKYVYIKNESSKNYLCAEGSRVKCTKRRNNKAWKFKLVKVQQPESGVSVDASTTFPVSIAYGHSFSLRGIVTSRYAIKYLNVKIVNASGKTVLEQGVSPGTNRYNLKGIDEAVTFGKLSPGSYNYQVTVTDNLGTVIPVIDRKFAVYVPGGSISRTLVYNSKLIDTIGHQSTGTVLEKKACASYALAYCNAVIHGTTPSPHDYWVNATTVDCVWSKGGYATSAYSSELQVLQAAYGQIVAGKPCILHVTGNTSQHWVALVGYQNVSSTGALTAGNFIALDPWDGTLISVGDKYKVKNTYRLAYYNS